MTTKDAKAALWRVNGAAAKRPRKAPAIDMPPLA